MPLPTFLQYHVMEGRNTVPTEPESTLTMLNGQDIVITVEGNKVSISNQHCLICIRLSAIFFLHFVSPYPVYLMIRTAQTMIHGKHNTSAEIVKANIHCANGVIHLIDNFLVPDYAEYEPPPYNSSLYDSFYPPLEELPPSNLPVPDDWYDEDEPSIGGNSLWGTPATNTAISSEASVLSGNILGSGIRESGTTVSAGVEAFTQCYNPQT